MAGENPIREQSGSVDSADPLVAFLYILMRDHLPVGEVEGIISNHVGQGEDRGCVSHYSNGWLAKYAEYLAGRLR